MNLTYTWIMKGDNENYTDIKYCFENPQYCAIYIKVIYAITQADVYKMYMCMPLHHHDYYTHHVIKREYCKLFQKQMLTPYTIVGVFLT